MNFKLFLLSIGLLVSSVSAQTKTNLEVVDSLIGLSINKISNSVLDKSNEFALNFNSPEDYKIFNNSIVDKLQKSGFNLSEEKNRSEILNYSIENIAVDYSDMFRDGIFGEYLIQRNINLNGSYFVISSGNLGNVNNYEYTFKDTVALNAVNSLQNIAYSFTSPEIPDEPFFSSLVEPTIAVGTAAIAVYLFFNIRSK
ncbi:MAG: hypothetical protein KDC52_01025 [Ignavibacteriae bacterium]|nr:hypothetical protein [Ignavibacteriota bacterium]MCB9249561.1 hypothetical protein [Ignavibacteriales bacterium]